MNDQPAILIEFDPTSWECTAIYFKSCSDEQTRMMQAILAEGMRSAGQSIEAVRYDS